MRFFKSPIFLILGIFKYNYSSALSSPVTSVKLEDADMKDEETFVGSCDELVGRSIADTSDVEFKGF